jgi:hypothetical protein
MAGTRGRPLFGLHSHRPFLEATLPTLTAMSCCFRGSSGRSLSLLSSYLITLGDLPG